MDKSLIGLVSKSSIVPFFFSSANIFIVIAGIRNKNTQGANIKSPSIPAKPKSKTLNPIGKTHRKSPITARKTIIVIYPINEDRKLLISFKNKVYILYVFQVNILVFQIGRAHV